MIKKTLLGAIVMGVLKPDQGSVERRALLSPRFSISSSSMRRASSWASLAACAGVRAPVAA